jgi:hypothetical protein
MVKKATLSDSLLDAPNEFLVNAVTMRTEIMFVDVLKKFFQCSGVANPREGTMAG